MATFLISEDRMISIEATEISHSGDFIIAWRYEDVVAMFRASEIVGCWLGRSPVKLAKMDGTPEN